MNGTQWMEDFQKNISDLKCTDAKKWAGRIRHRLKAQEKIELHQNYSQDEPPIRISSRCVSGTA